jgi:hypothetical protein
MPDPSLEPTMIREQAEAWALAIECGLADARGAVDWACELVAEQANPLAELIEIAGSILPHPRLLAEQGIYGSVEQVRAELVAFLEAEAE